MALDQFAPLEVLDALTAADVDDRIRQAAQTICQALIEAEFTSIGAAPHQRTPDRLAQRNGHQPGCCRTTAGTWSCASQAARRFVRQRWSPTPRRSPVSCPEPAGPLAGHASLPGCAPAAGQGHGHRHLDHDAVALAGRGLDQALAAPVVGSFPATPTSPPRLVVLDLYQRVFQAAELGTDEYVISADEKTSIQARCRCHRQRLRTRPRRLRAYLAWDVHHARLFGRCEPTTGIEPFDRLVAQVATTQPYALRRAGVLGGRQRQLHRGQASIRRLEGKYANLRLIHLPVHTSWLNQIEIYFSIVQRKVLTPNDFTDLAEVAQRLVGYQQTADRCWTGASPAPT